ncbi:MAG: hypothetical protein JST42_11100, partial [Bacteroidetes bacterium]|nr:hypothetical protein [Bacteroidota bacterium]
MNSPRNNISLQINLSASDLPICRQLLERQIGFWYDEVDEILLSVESQKSHGKFAVDFDANQAALTAFISTLAAAYPKLRYHYIDYSPARARVLSELFFAGVEIPHKDYRGGPFYCYFDGLAECRNRYIMHLDSDMILGGIPNTWLQDAVDLLRSDASYLFINPLAGPPRPDFGLRQEFHQRLGNYQFVFRKMSTRVFLTDRERLTAHPIRLRKINKTLRNWKWFFR